jgi:hypothetical protein
MARSQTKKAIALGHVSNEHEGLGAPFLFSLPATIRGGSSAWCSSCNPGADARSSRGRRWLFRTSEERCPLRRRAEFDTSPQPSFRSRRRGRPECDVQPKAITHAMQQRAHDFLRRRVLAADATHVPTAALFAQAVTHPRIEPHGNRKDTEDQLSESKVLRREP